MDRRAAAAALRRHRYAAIALAVFAAAVLANSGAMRSIFARWIPSQRVYFLVYAVQILLVFAGLWWAHRHGPVRALSELGFRRRVVLPLLFALAATAPMLIGFAWAGRLRTDVYVPYLLMTALLAPVVEELLYRGYVFRQLYRRGGWSFWIAALIPAVVFALGHLYQGHDVVNTVGVFGITAVGSVWFAWLFVRWSDNLWVPIFLHGLMNLWWYLFTVAPNALGGWLANVLRGATVLLSIGVTLYVQARRIDRGGAANAATDSARSGGG